MEHVIDKIFNLQEHFASVTIDEVLTAIKNACVNVDCRLTVIPNHLSACSDVINLDFNDSDKTRGFPNQTWSH